MQVASSRSKANRKGDLKHGQQLGGFNGATGRRKQVETDALH